MPGAQYYSSGSRCFGKIRCSCESSAPSVVRDEIPADCSLSASPTQVDLRSKCLAGADPDGAKGIMPSFKFVSSSLFRPFLLTAGTILVSFSLFAQAVAPNQDPGVARPANAAKTADEAL